MKKEHPKKVCFIGRGLTGGGMERALTSLANYFAEHHYDVIILNLFDTEVFYELHREIQLIWPGINRKKLHRFVYATALLPYIRKEIKKTRPDVILSFGEWFNAYVILATRFLGVRLFITNRMGPMLKLGFPLDNANRILYKYANGVIAQTQTAKEIIYKKTNNKNIKVIPNAVSPINVSSVSGKKQIVTVGRLSREKGHILLLKAFATLKHPDWTLHIVGDGPEREKLEQKTESLGLNNRVSFYGHKKEFSHILAASDIFVLPSYYEGFPNALIEAMSVPLACISSDCVAGPADIIQDGINGLLVEPGNVGTLASALNHLIENPELRKRLALAAYKVREQYNFYRIAKEYLGFLFSDYKNPK
ncbi:MAG: hypothetical protein B6D61_00535 [Bacteroidetes bacterium 4484_249]|nr:MAG: hypothetical protein B6D61_00535 [Bacteroidetes bacterium 4484_249]RLD74499.1 MAG: hypothetical protein DRI87_00815 [Bacteroidota bacterium]